MSNTKHLTIPRLGGGVIMKTWITTERATIERAREMLANQIADLPIWLRWHQVVDAGNGQRTVITVTARLLGVTAKRLKVKTGGTIRFADPARCNFAIRGQA